MARSFVDRVTIEIKSGSGGSGAVSFRREKYVPAGGPDGGDGGRGGNIIFVADERMSTLVDFRYKRKFVASNGMPGQGKKCSGKSGEDVYIKVPLSTVLKDAESGEIIHDMSSGEQFIAAYGGNGGWGNRHFATSTRQSPRFSKPGLPGEEMTITLELRLLADVGLVGFPNVGKSTLLSVVSNANPKIANYSFTTLSPNLGVVAVNEDVSFVLADIPGIIEGASMGIGLGYDFLRHIDRCRLLIHVVDASGSEGRDPIEDFNTINSELSKYSSELAKRPQIVAANKTDIIGDNRGKLNELKEYVTSLGYEFFEISAATHFGTNELMKAAAAMLSTLPPPAAYEITYVKPEVQIGTADEVSIVNEGDLWILEGDWLSRLVGSVNFSDHESRMYFNRKLRSSGIFDRLEKLGIADGDTVSIYDIEFDYMS